MLKGKLTSNNNELVLHFQWQHEKLFCGANHKKEKSKWWRPAQQDSDVPWEVFYLIFVSWKTFSFSFFSPELSLTINRNDQKEPPEATPCDLVKGSSHMGRTRKSWTLVSSLEWEPYLSEKVYHRFSPLGKDEVQESFSWGEIREYPKIQCQGTCLRLRFNQTLAATPLHSSVLPCTARLTSFRNKSQ